MHHTNIVQNVENLRTLNNLVLADCKPVLEKLLPKFESFVRSDIELRHRKRVLPDPHKPDKLHYRNLIAQYDWMLHLVTIGIVTHV